MHWKINGSNLIDKISDHVPNFLLIQEINNSKIKQKTKVRDTTNFEQLKFKNFEEIKILKNYDKSWTFLILKT